MKLEKAKYYTNNVSDLNIFIIAITEQTDVHLTVLANLYTKKSGRCVEYFTKYNISKNKIENWHETTNPLN